MNNKVNRSKTRKLLYQNLCANTFQYLSKEDFLKYFYDDIFHFNIDQKYLDEMIITIKEKEWFFIYIIEKYSPKFKFEQMSYVNILPIYIWLAEIFYYSEEIPIKTSINEAIEIAKTFLDESSKKMINWLLDKVLNNYEELKKEKDNSYPKSQTIFK